MKPLIMILLVALTAEAQTLAEAARQERQRQERVQSTRTITNADLNAPDARITEIRPVAPAETEASTSPSAQGSALQYREQLERTRARVRDLQDQEVALQLQVNQLTNQLFAPVTDQGSRDQAQSRIGEAQNRLTSLRGELAQSQRQLADLVAQGPPEE
jgi:hypothetical protein